MLKDFARRRRQETGSLEVEAEDQMDDGTPIRLKVQINEQQVRNHLNFLHFQIKISFYIRTETFFCCYLHFDPFTLLGFILYLILRYLDA